MLPSNDGMNGNESCRTKKKRCSKHVKIMLTPFIARHRRITFIFIPSTKTKFNYNHKKNTDMTDNNIYIDWMVLFY